MTTSSRVYVVDDDPGLCESLVVLLATANIAVTTFPSAEDFLRSVDPERPACVLLDVRLPGISGIELLEQLKERRQASIVIMITGHGDVPMAVSAMRAGVFHFVEKPFDPETMLSIVEDALQRIERIADEQAQAHDVSARYRLLTARELQVLDLLIDGRPSKLIASSSVSARGPPNIIVPPS